ncbi:GIY-YIG nuclease family protein [Gordonia sputi]
MPQRIDRVLAARTPRPSDIATECVHPGCFAGPQQDYDFVIPLCINHLMKVLAQSEAILNRAKRNYLIKNQGKKMPVRREIGHGQFHGPVVYYLQFNGRIKIGFTTNLEERLRAIPHDTVLAVEPGGCDIERKRHRQFRQHRVVGEWFEPSEKLLDHIKKLNDELAQRVQ